MSTRSIAAVETEAGIVGVYVHSDGYPEGKWGRLATYRDLIDRDGAAKVCETLLTHSHWSYVFMEDGGTVRPDELGVPGYGAVLESNNERFTPDQLDEWWDSEYVYVIHPETGHIRWAALGVRHPRGGGSTAAWDALVWQEA